MKINVKAAIEKIKSDFPDVWRRLTSKRFCGTDNYCNYYSGLVEIAAGLCYSDENKNALTKPETLAAIRYAQEGGQIFFISKPLIIAALNTSLPEDIDWKYIKLPFESALFVLPRNTLHNSASEEIACLYYARYGDQCFFTASFPSETIGDGLVLTGPFSPDKQYDVIPGEMAADSVFIKKSTSVIFNILFAMVARPEYVEKGDRRSFHRKSGQEVWTPNIIGAKYQYRYEGGIKGSHTSPRMHWRRGHYRQQRVGEGRHDSKIIWIEPTLINAAQTMEANA